MKAFVALAAMLLLSVYGATAQTGFSVEAYSQLHFGSGGLFPPTTPPRNGCIYTLEGCAVFRTPVFNSSEGEYWWVITDGVAVMDQRCRLAINGTGLMGHASSTQSALIIPRPGDSTRYYVFTAGAGPYVQDNNLGIRHSTVLITNNLWMQVTNKNTQLLDSAVEKLVGVGHCNDRDFWVIAHGWGSNNFYAWLVSDTGVAAQPVVSSVGAVHSTASAEYTIGYMKASPDGKKLVVVTNTLGRVQLFDFDNATGVVANPVDLPSVGSTYTGEYGASFSPNNTRLYISGVDSMLQCRLYQYTVTGTPAQIVASRRQIFSAPIVGAPDNQIGALQLYIDGRILCSRAQSNYIGVISFPDSAGLDCRYDHDGIRMVGGGSFGLPNNIDKMYNTGISCYRPRAFFGLSRRVICAGGCIEVVDSSKHGPTSWKWLFPGGTPAVSTQQHPGSVCYAQPGTYDVTLIVGNGLVSDTLLFPGYVEVRPHPQANAGPDQRLCAGDSVILTGSGGREYRWSPSTGLSSATSSVTFARPSVTTTYVLRASNGPCWEEDSVTVTVLPRPTLLGGSYSACDDVSIIHDPGELPGGTYRWTPATGVSDPTARMPMLTPAQSITYTVVGTDSNGCSASATVAITRHTAPVVAITADTAICAGERVLLSAQGNVQGTYAWSPSVGLDNPGSATTWASPVQTTTYRVVFSDENGCGAVDSITVVVHPMPVIDVGADTTICKGTALELHVQGSGGACVWSPAAGLESPAQRTTIARPVQTTMYYATVTDAHGCRTVDSVLVTVRSTAVSAGPDRAVCRGESVRLRAIGPSDGVYRWSPEDGLSDPTDKTPVAQPAETTVYTVEVTDRFGCTAVDSVTVAVVTQGTVDAGEDRTICRGDTIQLSSGGIDGVYSWTPVEGLSDPAIDNPLASPVQTTTYRLFVRSPGGCEAVDSVTVTVLPPPQVDAGADVALCRGGSVQLHATGSEGRYFWEPEEGLDNPAVASPRASPQTTTTYRVILLDNNGCRAVDSVTVVVAETLAVDAGPDRVLCAGANVQLQVQPTGDATVVWTPADGLDDPTSPTPLASPVQTTTYRVTVSDPSGCSGSDEVTVVVVPAPSVDAGADRMVCAGDTIALSCTGNEGELRWTPTDGIDNPASRTPRLVPERTTVYTVTLTTPDGCTAVDSVRVDVAARPVVIASADTVVCRDAEVRLTATAGPGTYRWEPAGAVEHPDRAATTTRPQATTMYTVLYTDLNGCYARDTVIVMTTDRATLTVVLPTVTAVVGSRTLRLPIVVRSNGDITEPVTLELVVQYDARVLQYTGITRGSLAESGAGADGVLTVRIDNLVCPAGETVIAELIATVLLSSQENTHLTFGSAGVIATSCVAVQGVDGAVSVDGVCFDSDFRVFTRPQIIAMPNPAVDILRVRLTGTVQEQPTVEVLTLWGAAVQVPVREELTAGGERTLVCDVSSLAAGVYSLVVRLSGVQYTSAVCILK